MGRGRKQIPIDWTTVDKLCGIQCTRREVAAYLEISEDTLDRATNRKFKVNFAAYSEKKSSGGKISLRRKQFELAMAGNVVMLIWLGKQYLDQSEKVSTIQEGDISVKITRVGEDDSPAASVGDETTARDKAK